MRIGGPDLWRLKPRLEIHEVRLRGLRSTGYRASELREAPFTVSRTHVAMVRAYVLNQERHHRETRLSRALERLSEH